MLEPGADLPAGCESVKRATEGALVLLLSPAGDEYDRYGCSQIEGDFGNKFVAETMIDDGVDEFVDRPLDALKVIVLNYDQLVKSEIVPDGARTIRPSGPRYIAAAEAAGTILSGAGVLYAVARRGARIAERVRARRDQATDSRTRLSASSAAVARLLIDIDRSQPVVASGVEYRRLAWEYAGLLDDVAAADRAGEFDYGRFTARADELATRLRALA
jgi:hypothetical protein